VGCPVAVDIERSRSATTPPTATALRAVWAADAALLSMTSTDTAAVVSRPFIRVVVD
jgi:hypothetical protein